MGWSGDVVGSRSLKMLRFHALGGPNCMKTQHFWRSWGSAGPSRARPVERSRQPQRIGGQPPTSVTLSRAQSHTAHQLNVYYVVCVASPSGWPSGTSLKDTAPLSMIAVCGSTGPDTEPEPPQTAIMETVVKLPAFNPTPNPEGLTTRTTKGPQAHRIMQ